MTKEFYVTPLLNFSFKGTVSVISIDPWCKNGNARLPTVPLVTLIWLKVRKKPSFFRLEKGLILMISLRFLKARKVQNSLLQETTNQNKKTWIYNSCLIRQSFVGYCCKSGIAIFAHGGSFEITLTQVLDSNFHYIYPKMSSKISMFIVLKNDYFQLRVLF